MHEESDLVRQMMNEPSLNTDAALAWLKGLGLQHVSEKSINDWKKPGAAVLMVISEEWRNAKKFPFFKPRFLPNFAIFYEPDKILETGKSMSSPEDIKYTIVNTKTMQLYAMDPGTRHPNLVRRQHKARQYKSFGVKTDYEAPAKNIFIILDVAAFKKSLTQRE